MPSMKQFMERYIERGSGFLTVISPEHRNYEEGGGYVVSGILGNLAQNASSYVQVKTASDGYTTAPKGAIISSDQLLKIEVFEAPTLTDGTVEMTVAQRARHKTTLYTCPTKFYTNPTVTATGTLIKTKIAGTGTFNKPVGIGVSDDMSGFNLKKGTNYLYKITNIGSATTTIIHFEQNLYMVADRIALW